MAEVPAKTAEIVLPLEAHPAANLFPMMDDDAIAQLAEDIKQNGQMVPIVTYRNQILDGRNRWRACLLAGVEPRIQEWQGIGSPLVWVLSLNLKRRHLDASQRAAVAVEALPLLEAEARERQRIAAEMTHQKLGRETDLEMLTQKVEYASSDRNDTTAAAQAAKLFGVNRQYVADAKRIAAASPDLLERMKTGGIALKEAKREMAKVETQQKREDLREQAKLAVLPAGIRFIQGDFRLVQTGVPADSVSLILTDPPYDEGKLNLWGALGSFAERYLKPGGLLVTYAGNAFLPEVMKALGSHLTYCWMAGVYHTGGHTSIWKYKVWNQWKPILVYCKGTPDFQDFEWWYDMYHGDKGNKSQHEWAQGEGEAAYYIEKLTKPGDLLADPMCGSGTVVRAALKLDRRAVGIEVDADRYAIAVAGSQR